MEYMTPREKAIFLIERFGFKGSRVIAAHMSEQMGKVALFAATEDVRDEFKNERFYWDTVLEIIKKEWLQRKLSI